LALSKKTIHSYLPDKRRHPSTSRYYSSVPSPEKSLKNFFGDIQTDLTGDLPGLGFKTLKIEDN
jgi:hypothetical protein